MLKKFLSIIQSSGMSDRLEMGKYNKIYSFFFQKKTVKWIFNTTAKICFYIILHGRGEQQFLLEEPK